MIVARAVLQYKQPNNAYNWSLSTPITKDFHCSYNVDTYLTLRCFVGVKRTWTEVSQFNDFFHLTPDIMNERCDYAKMVSRWINIPIHQHADLLLNCVLLLPFNFMEIPNKFFALLCNFMFFINREFVMRGKGESWYNWRIAWQSVSLLNQFI